MKRSLSQVIAAARALGGGPPETDRVAAVRQRRAAEIADALTAKGFPETAVDKAELSLVPLLFQEANYDDIGWTGQHDDMQQLAAFFELDHLVQCGGLQRADASPEAFAAYVKAAFAAIAHQRR